jgi:hypothetical protein
MQYCKPNNGLPPVDVTDRPNAAPNVSNPQHADFIAAGWLAYSPTLMPNVKESRWLQSGDEYLEVVEAQYTDDELSARAAQEAEQTAAREAVALAHAEAERAAQEAIVAAYAAKVQGLRDAYASATGQLCQLAGLPVVRVLTMAEIQTAVMPLLAGDSAGMVNGLLTLLTNIEGKLCREDGHDALDRV